MIDFRCACGAKIRVPAEAAGRRGTCKSCGEKFTVPMKGYRGDDHPLELELEPEKPRTVTRIAPPMPAAPESRRESASPGASRAAFEEARNARRQRPYAADAMMSFLAPLTPAGAAAIIGLVVVLMLMGFAPGLFSILAMIVGYGLLFAYCFEVIVETAGGEDDLPMPAGIEEWWEVLPGAFGGMLVTFGFLALFPVLTTIAMLLAGASEESVVLGASIAGGFSAFMLPVALLAVAMGGIGTLVRFDLLVRTILSAPLQYLMIWVMLLLAFGVQVALYVLLASAGAPTGLGGILLAELVANIVFVYTLIVCMRQIGLFYRHFSDRFPWTAG